MMLHYADLIKKNSIEDSTFFCPMCGRKLYAVYTAQEKRWYHICKKCSVVRFYRDLGSDDTDDDRD